MVRRRVAQCWKAFAIVATAAIAHVAVLVGSVAVAAAQADSSDPNVAETTVVESEVSDDSAAGLSIGDGPTTDDEVRVVVGSLLGIAGATAVGGMIFFWHTSPRRRLRIAGQRMHRRTE